MSLAKLMHRTGNAAFDQSDRIFGVVVGIVKSIKDPDRQGRVKVHFPWLADAKEEAADAGDDVAHSPWAPLATLMAGKKRGTFFVPEVGDEVLVAFEHGYIDRPVILGCLWNGDDPPPQYVDKAGKNDLRAIYSRSGHTIIFNDSTKEPSLTIVDKTGENSIRIDSAHNAMTIKVKGNLTIDVGGDILISAKGKIAIQADDKADVKAKGDLNLTAGGSGALKTTGGLKVAAGADLALTAKTQAEVKATTTLSLNGGAMTEVKGSLVKIN